MARHTKHTESQEMFALHPLLNKPGRDDKEIKQLRARIVDDQNELKALLEQRVGQAEQETTRRSDEIAALIHEALTSSNLPAQNEQLVYTGTKIAGNAVYIATTDILAASEGLLAEYHRLENMVSTLQDDSTGPIGDIWKQDIELMEAQLKMGARVAIRNVKKVLGAEVEGEDVVMTDQDGDENIESVGSGERQEVDLGLQKSLRYAERGVKRMVKGLPADELD